MYIDTVPKCQISSYNKEIAIVHSKVYVTFFNFLYGFPFVFGLLTLTFNTITKLFEISLPSFAYTYLSFTDFERHCKNCPIFRIFSTSIWGLIFVISVHISEYKNEQFRVRFRPHRSNPRHLVFLACIDLQNGLKFYEEICFCIFGVELAYMVH